jgi:hypothetical protein
MMYLLAFLLLATPSADRLELVNDTFRVETKGRQIVHLSLQQDGAVIEVSYRMLSGEPHITVVLSGPQPRSSNTDRPNTYLRYAPGVREGHFRYPAATKGEYQIALYGRNLEEDAEVALEVVLDFEEVGLLRPGLLSRGRRYSVIALSLLFFFAVSFWSGGKLLLALRRRSPSSPRPRF